MKTPIPAAAPGFGEFGVLAQEAVAGVDGVDGMAAGGVQDFFDVEIAFGGGRWT